MVSGLMVRRLDSLGLDGEGLDSERLAHEVLDRSTVRELGAHRERVAPHGRRGTASSRRRV